MKKYRKLGTKISLLFLFLVLLVAAVVGNLTYLINYNNTFDYCKQLMTRCGKYVDDIIDAGSSVRWLEKGKDDLYGVTLKDLEAIRNDFQISYLYVYRPIYDNSGEMTGDFTVIFDLNPDDADESKRYQLGDIVSARPEFEQAKAVMGTGKEQFTSAIHTANEGFLLMTLVPLELENGKPFAVICICYPVHNIIVMSLMTSAIQIVVVELVIVIFAIVLQGFIRRRIIRPVKLLSGRMDSFVSSGGEMQAFEPIIIHTQDEIEQMTDNFNSMAESIIQNTKEIKTMAASRERLRAELDVAKNVRSAISADISYPAFRERSDFELHASMKNTVNNSCSFCDYFLADEEHLFIVLGESVGKSLPSMLMSALASTNICALAKMSVEPYQIAYETNNNLCPSCIRRSRIRCSGLRSSRRVTTQSRSSLSTASASSG